MLSFIIGFVVGVAVSRTSWATKAYDTVHAKLKALSERI